MQKRNIFDFNQVQKVINQYHKNPTAILTLFNVKKE
jgi:hypothetical protein